MLLGSKIAHRQKHKKGDYEMKNETLLNKIIHGDCLEEMKTIEDKSIDLILCDLPYGTMSCSWDNVIPFDKLWEQYNRIIKDNGNIVLFGTQPFTTDLINSNRKMYKHINYWNKENSGSFAVSKYRPMPVVEEIIVFAKGTVKYNPQMVLAEEKNKRPRGNSNSVKNDTAAPQGSGKYVVSGKHNENLRYPKNLLTYNSRKGELNATKRLHPTQKPVELTEWLIKTYSNEGDVVLDNCAGSGTTGVAAVNTGRNFILMEKEWEFCEIANKRIEEVKSNK